MKVDTSNSVYQEDPGATSEFNRRELRRCRLLLRRLRFLETKAGGIADANNNGGAAFAEWESDALEWILTEVGFLAERKKENS